MQTPTPQYPAQASIEQLSDELRLTCQALAQRQDQIDWLTGETLGEDFSYSAALIVLQKRGARLARRSWGPTGSFIQLITPVEVPPQALFVRGSPDGSFESWTPTAADQLTHDWYRLS